VASGWSAPVGDVVVAMSVAGMAAQCSDRHLALCQAAHQSDRRAVDLASLYTSDHREQLDAQPVMYSARRDRRALLRPSPALYQYLRHRECIRIYFGCGIFLRAFPATLAHPVTSAAGRSSHQVRIHSCCRFEVSRCERRSYVSSTGEVLGDVISPQGKVEVKRLSQA
jgi:hypothetical protein